MSFNKNQSLFLARIRPPIDSELHSEDTLQTISKSPSPESRLERSRKKYSEDFPYSCFSDPSETKILLSQRCLSGNLLNRSLSSKITSECEAYHFDLVQKQGEEICAKACADIAKNLIKGRNSNVFVYGARKSGKTYCIRGSDTVKTGILQVVFREVHRKIRKKGLKSTENIAEISVFMVYNNEIYDLLQFGNEYRQNSALLLKRKGIRSKEDLILALHQALNARKILGCELKKPDIKRKSHLVIRVGLSEEGKGLLGINKEKWAEINIVELADANFMRNNDISPSEKENLDKDFNGLFDRIVDSYSSKHGQKHKKQKNNPVLVESLKESLNIRSKTLFLCCLAPSLDQFQANKQSLKFSASLRSLIRDPGEKIPNFNHKKPKQLIQESSVKSSRDSLPLYSPTRNPQQTLESETPGFEDSHYKANFTQKSLSSPITDPTRKREESKHDSPSRIAHKTSPKPSQRSQKSLISDADRKLSTGKSDNPTFRPHTQERANFSRINTVENGDKKPLTPAISRERANSLRDLAGKSEKGSLFGDLRDRKTRFFDVIDKEEEIVVSGQLQDLKRADLIKEFRTLFYKSRELKEILSEFHSANKKLEKENFEIRKENEESVKKCEILESEINEGRGRLEREIDDNRGKEREIEILKRENEENREEIAILREKVGFYQAETKKFLENEHCYEESRLLANKKEGQIRDFIAEISEKNEFISRLKQEIDKRSELIRDLEDRNKDLEDRNKDLLRKIEIKGANNTEFKGILQEKIAQNHEIAEKMTDISEKLKEREFKLETTKAVLEFTEKLNAELKSKNKDLESENISLKSQKNALERELQLKAGIEGKNSQIIRDFSSENRVLEKSLEEALLARKTLENEVSNKERVLKEERTKNEEFKEKFESLYRKTLKLEKENDELKGFLEKFSQKTREQEKSLEIANRSIEDREWQLSSLEKHLKTTENEHFSVKEKNSELVKEIELLKKSIESKEKENFELENTVKNLEESLSKTKSQVSSLRFEGKRIKEEFSSREKELKMRFYEEIEDKENLIQRLSEEKEKEFSQNREKQQKLQVLSEVQSLIASHRGKLKK